MVFFHQLYPITEIFLKNEKQQPNQIQHQNIDCLTQDRLGLVDGILQSGLSGKPVAYPSSRDSFSI